MKEHKTFKYRGYWIEWVRFAGHGGYNPMWKITTTGGQMKPIYKKSITSITDIKKFIKENLKPRIKWGNIDWERLKREDK